jgi:hypothetical protein
MEGRSMSAPLAMCRALQWIIAGPALVLIWLGFGMLSIVEPRAR